MCKNFLFKNLIANIRLIFSLILVIMLTANVVAHSAERSARSIVLDDDSDELLGARFTLQHILDSSRNEVALTHTFYTSDRFRFVIRPNKPAYLYVVNINPEGSSQLIWPPRHKIHDIDNRVIADQPNYIPRGKKKFKFTGDSGSEWLLIVLSPEKRLPDMNIFQNDLALYRNRLGEVFQYPDVDEYSNRIKTDTGLSELDVQEVQRENIQIAEVEEDIPQINSRDISKTANTIKPGVDDIGTYAVQRNEGKLTLVFPYLLNHKAR